MSMGNLVIGLAVLLVACGAPFAVELYRVEVLIMLLFNLILAQSYRMVNTTGDWSLIHVVIMGVGAYAAALVSKLVGVPFWLSVPIAGCVAALIGGIAVLPLLRTVGFGFFIASFAIGEFIRLVWIKFQDPFGGARGLINIPPPELFGFQFFDLIHFYFLTLAVTAVAMWVMWRIDRSAMGHTFKAIHMDPVLCETVGIRVPRYRAVAFMTGAFFAGIAGALMAHHQGAIDPHNFEVTLMVYLIIFVVVGGIETFWGPVLGVVVMTAVFEATRPLEEWRPLIAGGILILFLVVLPGGLELLLPRGVQFVRRLFGGRRNGEADAPAGRAG